MKRAWAALSLLGLSSLGGCYTISAHDLEVAPPGNTFNEKGEYLLGPGDRVEIRVQGNPNFDGSYAISPSGALSLPLVGFVRAEGLSLNQLVQNIEVLLKEFLKDPRVSANLAAVASYRVFFGGEVRNPGVFSFSEKTSILKALAVAGGPARFASGRIVLLRSNRHGVASRYAITIDELIEGRGANIHVERDDFLYLE